MAGKGFWVPLKLFMISKGSPFLSETKPRASILKDGNEIFLLARTQNGDKWLLPQSGILGLKSLLLICPGQMMDGPGWLLAVLQWFYLLNSPLEGLNFVFKRPFETMT